MAIVRLALFHPSPSHAMPNRRGGTRTTHLASQAGDLQKPEKKKENQEGPSTWDQLKYTYIPHASMFG